MAEKGASLKPEERTRFEGQQRVVREVVAIFEVPAYSTENAAQNVRVVTLMNEVRISIFPTFFFVCTGLCPTQ